MRLFSKRKRITRQLRAKADAARDARQWPVAAALYEAYLSDCQNDAPIWIQLGHAHKEAGSDAEAMRAYQTSLALAPNVADTHLQMGHLLKKMGRYGDAAASYETSSRLGARLQTSSGGGSQAGEGFEAVDGRDAEESPDFLLPLANAARDDKRWADAAKHYALYLERQGGTGEVWPIWVQLGHARKEAGDADEAVAAYERAVELHPEADTYLHLGHLHKTMGAIEAAAAAFAAALRLDPDLEEAAREKEALTSYTAGTSSRQMDSDRAGPLRLAFPFPLSPDQVTFTQAFPAIYTGLSRRFSHEPGTA
jgi:tetratricopeptide (TPR) repeat protein